MKKKFTKLMAALALLVFIAPSLVAWGQTQSTYTKVTAAPTDWSGEYLLVYEANNTAYVWTGVDASGCNVTTSLANTITIPSGAVSLTIESMTGGYSIKVNGGTNNGKYIYGTSGSNKTNFGTTASVNTITYESSNTKIVSNTSVMRFNSSSNNGMWFRYYKSSSYSNQQPVQLYKLDATSGDTPSITAENENIGYEASTQQEAIAYSISNYVEGTMTATSDKTWLHDFVDDYVGGDDHEGLMVFSADLNEGLERSATVTLTYTYGDNQTATQTVTVTQAANPNAPGTQTTPYTVAQALAANPATGVYVHGIISTITEVSTQYGNATYNISDDGTHSGEMIVFRGRYLNNTDFTSTDQIQVGDQVVVTGNLSDYQGTNQLAQGNYLVSLTRPATIVIPAEALALPCTANDNGSFAVSYTNNFVAADAEANLYTDAACNEAFQDDWIILDDMSTPYDAITYVLEANPTTTSRTVYMKVTAMDSELNILEKVFTITQAGQPTYTVTYVPNGGSGTMNDPDSPYIAGDIVELLTNTFTAPEGMVWDSWAVTDAGNNEVTVEGGMFEMPASNVTVTAQWITDPSAPQYEWVLTDLAELTSTDIFVIVGTRDATNYYGMSNNNGTSTQPSAVGVTIANNKLSSDPADNIKWNVSGDNTNGYVFYPNGSTTTWLYCNTTASSSSNTNMRVGTGDRKLFVLDNNNYLVTKDEYTDRYVSLNGSTDWRGYTNTGQATVISFYKRQVASTDPAVYTSVSSIDLAYYQTSGSFTYDLENTASEYTMNVTVNSEAQSWLSATINTATSTVTITAAVNDGEQRQGIVTVNYLEGEIIKAYEQVTVTQAEFVIDYATLPFVFVGNEDETPTGVTTTAGTYSASPYLKFDGTGKYLTLKLNDAPLSLSYDIKVNGTYGTESVFDVLTSADGQAWASLVSYTTLSTDVQTVTHLDLPSTVRYIKWIYTNKDSGNVALGNIHASAEYDIYGNVTVENLTIPATKTCTVYDGAILNVTTSLTNEATQNAWEHLIIKDGAQLKTPNAVNGTIEKAISGYGASTNGKYVLLATPASMDACNNTGMWPTTGTDHQLIQANIDFYSFNQSSVGAEWQNFKHGYSYFAGPYLMQQGQGYLYANPDDVTLTLQTRGYSYPSGQTVHHDDYPFAPTNSNSNISVSLSYSAGVPFAGFNLIGNPFTCTAYLADGRDFYRMNPDGDAIVLAEDNAINVCEGIFVVAANTNDNSVTFTTTEPEPGDVVNNSMINLSLTKDRGALIDNARIRFGEGNALRKIEFGNNSRIYFAQGNHDYAVVRSNAQGELPVSFKASANGTYTLSVNPENVEMNYLHLIDNMTGNDVDLLATPSYSFEAKTSDYASRFRLVFSANSVEEQSAEPFAFFNGDSWTVSNQGEATLQVIDMMGRVLSSETLNGNANVNLNQTAGIYMLRLVNGENVRTQKVVVR